VNIKNNSACAFFIPKRVRIDLYRIRDWYILYTWDHWWLVRVVLLPGKDSKFENFRSKRSIFCWCVSCRFFIPKIRNGDSYTWQKMATTNLSSL